MAIEQLIDQIQKLLTFCNAISNQFINSKKIVIYEKNHDLNQKNVFFQRIGDFSATIVTTCLVNLVWKLDVHQTPESQRYIGSGY